MAKQATQTMELTQATQMLQWLEEERRKDKAAIAALQEQVRNEEQQLSQQSALVQDLQTTMASIQNLISQVADFEQTVSNYKNEMVFLLDQREDTWKKERAEADRLRKIEFEAITDQLSRLDKGMQTVARHEEDLQTYQAEDQRLNTAIQRLEVAVADLNARSDDRVQAVTYLEEQRRADNRRIAELEQEATELRKRGEAQAAKMLLLEETIQKQRARIDEAIKELKEFEKPIEEMRVAEFRREQAVKKYMDQAEQVNQEMEEWRAQTQSFFEQYKLNK
jgi:chromosome segregation ATPase